MRAQLATRLGQVRRDAIALAGAALKISQAIEEAFERGGRVTMDAQVNFITGAHARLLKDLGAINHLQMSGAALRPRPRTR